MHMCKHQQTGRFDQINAYQIYILNILKNIFEGVFACSTFITLTILVFYPHVTTVDPCFFRRNICFQFNSKHIQDEKAARRGIFSPHKNHFFP